MTETTMGRRERKKAATRQALADAALKLFLERGYDQVGVKDVAEAADVSTTTLFKHFSGKEALVFDMDADKEAALVAAVRDRPAGRTIPDALRTHILATRFAHPDNPRLTEFLDLVENTPALRDYSHRMWLRHQTALARAIAADIGVPADDPSCAALALFALEAPSLTRNHPDPRHALNGAFDLLTAGWSALHPTDAGT
ncbi:TetR/AcrR family transcriptional regulator [Streptomyces sp. CBMA29]|uniref:TetR/AcrR family transcriptional regulator n=1 Tax=Streptomyces sp. CBMA29 TaxID=1896314 RepID=UPI00166213FB|nr:TetR/AcrR family transcriptional regulator [Streptomyces sp. CBMA29]MBD0740474.1 TetR family transcriptional regulator [Streptomyces sp. CBMA29]